jgi:hypothetical protein
MTQRYTIFFIAVNALHVSGGFSAHHQLNCTHSRKLSSLLAATASGGSKQAWHTRCCVYSFEFLMMGGETARNMYSIASNKEYCITRHLVGYTKNYYITIRQRFIFASTQPLSLLRTSRGQSARPSTSAFWLWYLFITNIFVGIFLYSI